MIWDILQKKIEDAGIASEAAETLYLNEMPGDLKEGVMMRAPLSGVRIDPFIPGFYKPTLQFIVRHTRAVEGEKMAYRLMNALKIQAEETYPATDERGQVQLKVFFPRELPIQYPRLDGGTIEWSLNFTTAFTLGEQ